jgi:hypothetical protein
MSGRPDVSMMRTGMSRPSPNVEEAIAPSATIGTGVLASGPVSGISALRHRRLIDDFPKDKGLNAAFETMGVYEAYFIARHIHLLGEGMGESEGRPS